MKKIILLVTSTTLSILLGSMSSTCFARGDTTGLFKSNALAKIVGSPSGVSSEKLQRLGEQYDSLHKSLLSSPFNPQVEQQFQAFRSTLDKVNAISKNEAMLYVAALASNRDAADHILKEHNLYLSRALDLAMEDGPNWDALEFMVDLDRNRARYALDNLVLFAAHDGDKEVVEKLIEIGASPTKALTVAAHRNNKEFASRLMELGADLHQALYEIDGNVEAGKFLIELGADVNLALFGFAKNYADFFVDSVEREVQANQLIEVFGADPLLVSIYLEKGTYGFQYLSKKYDTYFNIDLAAGSANVVSFRPMLMKNTEQFAKAIEFITPSRTRQMIEEGANVNLALLYLARDKDTIMTKHLIDRLGANPATVARLAQAGGEEDTAAFLRDLAEMEQLKHSIDEH